jgi:hypothetical protein
MLEYGKLLRTLHALRWFTDEAFRRRIGRQLNRGEATNDLRRFIFFANRGAVRSPHHDDQTTQAHCHTLVVNACVLSTTGYLEDAVDAEEADGHQVTDEAKAHLSFAHFETVNPYGTMVFDIAGVLNRSPAAPPPPMTTFTAMTMQRLAAHVADEADADRRWSLLLEFMEEYEHEPANQRPSLVDVEPGGTNDVHWDALLAGIADWLAARDGFPTPPWVGTPERSSATRGARTSSPHCDVWLSTTCPRRSVATGCC